MQPKDLIIPIQIPEYAPSANIVTPGSVHVNLNLNTMVKPPEQTSLDSLIGNLNKPSNDPGLLYTYSPNEIKPWRNGPVYSPYVDMEDAYAKADPFTFGDVMSKAWSTTKNHIGSSYFTMGAGLKEMAKGNWSGFWNNEYSKHLADLTEELEQLKPLYRTKDERDNPLAFRNLLTTTGIFLPALGTVTATLVDVAIGHAIASVGGALLGPGGVIGANIAALAKDSVALKGAFNALWATSKLLQGTGGARKVANLSRGLAQAEKTKELITRAKALGAGLFYANGEAALQAELNSRKYLKERQQEYFDLHGKYAQGEALDKLTETSRKVGNLTYSLNLPLIAATQINMFGNFMLGKAAPLMAAQLPIKYVTEKGITKAVQTKSAPLILKETLKDMASEGIEEFGQSVIDNAVSKYYNPLINTRKGVFNFTGQLVTEAVKHAQTQEGVMDFLGGAVIGGVVRGAKGASREIFGNTLRAQAEQVVSQFNSTTDRLIQNTLGSEYRGQLLQEAFNNRDYEKINNLIGQEAFAVAQEGVFTGTIDARKAQLESLKEMDIEDFNTHFNLNIKDNERNNFVDQIVDRINKAEQVVSQVNNVYGVNPFRQAPWFQSLSGYLNKSLKRPDKLTKDMSQKLWSDFKSIVAYNIYEHNDLDTSLGEIKEMFGSDSYLVSSDLGSVVKQFKEISKSREVIDESYGKILEEIDGLPVTEQYDKIIEFLGIENKTLLNYAIKSDISRRLALDDMLRWQTPTGQRELINTLAEYIEYLYKPKENVRTDESSTTNRDVSSVESVEENQQGTAQEEEIAEEVVEETSEEPGLSKKEELKQLIEEIEAKNEASKVRRENRESKSNLPIDPVAYSKLSIKDQINNHQDGYSIGEPGKYMVVRSNSGELIKGTRISHSPKGVGKGYFMSGVPVSEKSFTGQKLYNVTDAVINKDVDVKDMEELTAPEQRELGKRPAKKAKTSTLNRDKYLEEISQKYGKKSSELAKEQELLRTMGSIIDIIC